MVNGATGRTGRHARRHVTEELNNACARVTVLHRTLTDPTVPDPVLVSHSVTRSRVTVSDDLLLYYYNK
jgi:hypothetical protein